MLRRQIERERQRAVETILGHYRVLYLPHAMLVPSARFGLYATAKALLFPGDRVLISPITCRTVIYALLAAGVTPVFVDIELATGNIDVSRLRDAELSMAQAILTTNLYGNPDAVQDLKAVAGSRGLLLIEDCAHVLHTRLDGQEIGSVGDVSVFSFKKHFDQLGGVVCVRDEGAAARIQAIIAADSTMPSAQEERLRYCQFRLAKATSPAIVRNVSSVYRRFGTAGAKGENNRQPTAVVAERSPALSGSLPTTATLLRMVGFLQKRQEIIQARASAAGKLIARCPLLIKSHGGADKIVYLAVPFFSTDRDAIVAKLRSADIPTYFLYTPPMSALFQGRTRLAAGLDKDRIAHWCGNILPVLPQCGDQFLEVIDQVFSGRDKAWTSAVRPANKQPSYSE